MGKSNIKDFRAKYPNANIKQVTTGDISSSATAQVLKANPDAYDFALGDQTFVGQAMAAGIIQDVDFSQVPNIKNVDSKFREAYSHGIPTDYGKTGIGYRSDLVDEDITSWADVWNLAEKYSNKIVFTDLDLLPARLVCALVAGLALLAGTDPGAGAQTSGGSALATPSLEIVQMLPLPWTKSTSGLRN